MIKPWWTPRESSRNRWRSAHLIPRWRPQSCWVLETSGGMTVDTYILYIYISIYKLLPPSWCHPKLFDHIRVGRSMGQDQISPQIGFLNVIQMINTEKKHYSFNPIPPSNNDKNIVWNRHHFAICSIEIAMWGVSQHSCQTVPKTIPSQASMPTEVGPAGTLRRNFVDPDD